MHVLVNELAKIQAFLVILAMPSFFPSGSLHCIPRLVQFALCLINISWHNLEAADTQHIHFYWGKLVHW